MWNFLNKKNIEFDFWQVEASTSHQLINQQDEMAPPKKKMKMSQKNVSSVFNPRDL
jgi:hypothetical protein